MNTRDAISAGQPFRLGSVLVHPAENYLVVEKTKKTIEPKVMEVLVFLAINCGKPQSAKRITKEIWHHDRNGESPVYGAIFKLREAAGSPGEHSTFIKSQPNVGYSLLVEPKLQRKPEALKIIVTGLSVFVIAALFFALSSRKSGNEELSLAILPLKSIEADVEIANFGSGIADELHVRLSQIEGLLITPQRDSNSFSTSSMPLKRKSELLQANYVLHGSIFENNERLIVNAMLYEGATDSVLWTESFDGPINQIYTVLTDISLKVARSLPIKNIDDQSIIALENKPTQDPITFGYYLSGLYYLNGLRDLKRLKFAEELFAQAISEDPQFARAHAALCQTHLQQSIASRDTLYFEKAERHCHRAITQNPNLPEAKIALGILYRVSGQYELSKQTLRAVLKKDPTNIEALVELGDAYLKTGAHAEAERHYKEAVAIRSGDYSAQTALGAFYYRRKSFDQAVSHLEFSSKLRPDSSRAHSNLAMAYWSSNKLDKARMSFDKSLSIQPSRIAFNNRGLFHFYQNDFAASIEDFHNAIRLAKDDAKIYGHLADAMRHLPSDPKLVEQTYLKAIELARKKLSINPNDSEILIQLAKYQAHVGAPEHDVQALINRAHSLSADNADTYYIEALTWLIFKNYSKTSESLQQAIDLGYRHNLIKNEPDLKALSTHTIISPVWSQLNH